MADRAYALATAQIRVMDLAAMARVTQVATRAASKARRGFAGVRPRRRKLRADGRAAGDLAGALGGAARRRARRAPARSPRARIDRRIETRARARRPPARAARTATAVARRVGPRCSATARLGLPARWRAARLRRRPTAPRRASLDAGLPAAVRSSSRGSTAPKDRLRSAWRFPRALGDAPARVHRVPGGRRCAIAIR